MPDIRQLTTTEEFVHTWRGASITEFTDNRINLISNMRHWGYWKFVMLSTPDIAKYYDSTKIAVI